MNDRDCENCKHHTEKGCDSWDCEFEQKMTKEEIHREKEQAYMQGYEDASKKYRQEPCDKCVYSAKDGCQYDDITEAIPPFEPCEDAISKQAVLDIIKFEYDWLLDAKGHNADTKIAFSGMKSKVLALPPVNPQEPKTGRWIESDTVLIVGYTDTDNYINLPAQECSICHKPHIRGYGAYYCPNCGAKMEESEDKE